MNILVAMSGGVDSSVTAALLVRAGYQVTGAFMKQWSDAVDEQGICTWLQDRREAIRVAAHLRIPLLTWDFEKEYRDQVATYMMEEYEAGRTPNPDVLCNTYIKFGTWLKKAQAVGFTHLATGHYAQVELSDTSKQYELRMSKDTDKDQTYFLHQLNQEQLSHVLFPIGKYTKTQVRALAKKLKLPTAERAESMGICFIGEMPMKEFLEKRMKRKPGNIITTAGEVLGKHDGLAFYTIGQRHIGETFQTTSQKGATQPLYVVDKRFKTNELVVGFTNDPLLYRHEISVENLIWVSGQATVFPLHCKVRFRHREPLKTATIAEKNGHMVIICKEPERAPTPGQFAVFYKEKKCLGGGVIFNKNMYEERA